MISSSIVYIIKSIVIVISYIDIIYMISYLYCEVILKNMEGNVGGNGGGGIGWGF
mgnify:FL=1